MTDNAIKCPSSLCVVGSSSLLLSYLGKLINYNNAFKCLDFRFVSPNSHMYIIVLESFIVQKEITCKLIKTKIQFNNDQLSYFWNPCMRRR